MNDSENTTAAISPVLSTDGLERMEREAFEKFVVAPPFEYSTERMTELSAWPGNYRSIAVQLAWESWKARAASSDCKERR